MNGDNGQGGGIGCVMWLCIAMAFGALILVISGGDDTTHTSADLEALSRNQINIASKVNNSYFDCNAAGSCIWTDTTTTTSTSTTNTSTDVNGDRNTVGVPPMHWCALPTGAGYWTHNPCDAGYTQTSEEAQP